MEDIEIKAIRMNLKQVARKIVRKEYIGALIKEINNNLKYYYDGKSKYIYISKDVEKIKKALDYDKEINQPLTYSNENFQEKLEEYFNKQEEYQYKLGRLFGYPLCCIKEYIRLNKVIFLNSHNGTSMSEDNISNYVINSYNNTRNKDKLNFLLNNITNVTIISHFPCSYECEKSIGYAKKLFESFEEDEKVDIIKKLSQKLVVWSEHKFKVFDGDIGSGILFSFS